MTHIPESENDPSTLPATLTPRQVQILQLIRDYRSSNGCSPTLEEMAAKLQISKVTVFEHVAALVQKEMLLREPNKARSLILKPLAESIIPSSKTASPRVHEISSPHPAQSGSHFPLVGDIAAGVPLEAIENPDVLDINSLYKTTQGTFVLRVRGDSMIDEHIQDGDYVMVEKSCQARNGQIVVAVLENGEATLKKFYRDGQGARLVGANPDFANIYVDQVDIQGIVIGVVRVIASP